jgi:hypothetical protein
LLQIIVRGPFVTVPIFVVFAKNSTFVTAPSTS